MMNHKVKEKLVQHYHAISPLKHLLKDTIKPEQIGLFKHRNKNSNEQRSLPSNIMLIR
ncbi:hypothetical protein LDG_7973 [Legionella drancourtii LLAP12]|uniref:Uncharacterized protein n=1 Tax=Legionella drancourtii LLAP12 TaxID=658187 RepID=G9ERQ5_9GAMM|nr:hypothetical protein LDG_7973 [Legionella drancourtii LLAP12]